MYSCQVLFAYYLIKANEYWNVKTLLQLRFRWLYASGTATDSYINRQNESSAEIRPERRSRSGRISAGKLRVAPEPKAIAFELSRESPASGVVH